MLVRTKGITKHFPGVRALSEVDFELDRGEIHAILGENGAGKSTLIKILAGFFKPDEGTIEIEDKLISFDTPHDSITAGIGVIHQELNLALNLSIAENIYFGRLPQNRIGIVNKKKLYSDSEKILRKIGMDINPATKVRFLSIAQQQLVEIAKAISQNAKIVIMDEPTSSLSPKEIALLFDIMRELKQHGIGIIYVSHKLDELFAVCDKVTILRDGCHIKTLDIANTNEEEMIRLMVGRCVTNLVNRSNETQIDVAMKVTGLTSYKLKNISFNIHKGEIIGFSGLMGAGKTEVARAIFGLDSIENGDIEINGKSLKTGKPHLSRQNGLGFVPEDRKQDGIYAGLSVQNNMTISTLNQVSMMGKINSSKEELAVNNQIEILRIKTPSLRQKIANLSGGNQQKVILSRWLLSENLKVLIIDEPTRGIDVCAKFEIYQIMSELAQKGIAIIVMSSEMQELIGLCDRIFVLKEGQIRGEVNKLDASEETLLRYAVS